MALCFLGICHKNFFMGIKLKNHWFILRLLLVVNLILFCTIVFMRCNLKSTSCENNTEKNIKNLSADAVNSITIKLM